MSVSIIYEILQMKFLIFCANDDRNIKILRADVNDGRNEYP